MEEKGISDIPVMQEDDEMQTCDIRSKAQENRFPLTAISNHHCGWYWSHHSDSFQLDFPFVVALDFTAHNVEVWIIQVLQLTS